MKNMRETSSQLDAPLKSLSPNSSLTGAKKTRKVDRGFLTTIDPNLGKVISQFAAIADFMGDAILCQGVDGTVAYTNAAAEKMLGYSNLELQGRPYKLVLSGDGAEHEEKSHPSPR